MHGLQEGHRDQNRPGNLHQKKKALHRMVAPDKKTLKKSVKSMFFMNSIRNRAEEIIKTELIFV